ncbi:MAG: dihydrodipicolinate synthase family protein [candidate division KSB1 bacterium]|nr:dihydrodipicolinate synthase family protein [candidate division KSB1 bacterium]
MKKPKPYSGVIVPMITPITADGAIDEAATVRLVQFFIEHGVAPFAFGTTGESASIPDNLRPRFIRLIVETVAGRQRTFVGISSNRLDTAVELSRIYFDAGVDVVVAHLPYYYDLTPEQMQKYLEALIEAVPGKIMLYNIPATTHLSIPLSVVDALSRNENVVGLKDSERNLDRLHRAITMWRDREDFSFFVGWGAQLAAGLLRGADGVVPSTANVVPHWYRQMYEAAVAGDAAQAEAWQRRTEAVSRIYQANRTLGQSLAALKVMMHALGLCEPHVLPPLTRLKEEEEAEIIREMKRLQLL